MRFPLDVANNFWQRLDPVDFDDGRCVPSSDEPRRRPLAASSDAGLVIDDQDTERRCRSPRKRRFFGTHSRDHESDCCQLKIETVSPLAKLKPDRLTASPEQRRYRSNFSQLSLVRGTIRYLRTLKATALASSGDTASLNLAVAGPIRDPLQRGGCHARAIRFEAWRQRMELL